jgi:hypothetical protein
MDLTAHIPALIEGTAQVPVLLQDNSAVVCSGRRALLSKLQARDRTQAAVTGLRLGLVSWP